MDFPIFIVVVLVGLLSYEMPIYAARLLGLEGQLNLWWQQAFADSLGSGILLVTGWMVAGTAMWLLPAILIYRFGRRVARDLAERRKERATLRKLYREEFRHRFKTFKAFEAFVNGGGTVGEESPQPAQMEAPRATGSEAYQDALAMFSLPADCTREAMVARYRELSKLLHPDKVGNNDLFRRLTEARDMIVKRRGWRI